jgi:ribosomal protein L31E
MLRQSLRIRLRHLALLFLISRLLISDHAIAQVQPDVVVHLSISGGYRYHGTLTGPYTGIDYFCATQQTIYAVNWNVSALLKVKKGNFKKNAFSLLIRGYSSFVSRYTNSENMDITVVVNRHAYIGTASDPKYRIRVQIGQKGRSGTFSATHLTAMRKFHGAPVNVAGSWSCATLLKG